MRTKFKAFNEALGLWFHSGHCIFLLNRIEEDVVFDTKLGDQEFKILIDWSTEKEQPLSSFFSNS